MSGPISTSPEPVSACAIEYGVETETSVSKYDSRGRDEEPAASTRPRAVTSPRDCQTSAWKSPQREGPVDMDRGIEEEDGGCRTEDSQCTSVRGADSPPVESGYCHLLELPPELRENIWIHALTEWQSSTSSSENGDEKDTQDAMVLHKKPIRLDKHNRPGPPAITATCSQIRSETLHLYYKLNIFECWRPLFLDEGQDWLLSTFGNWITSLSPDRISWLRNVVLLYKHENELENDIWWMLEEAGIELHEGVISDKRELSEYEMAFQQLGLPRHFGKRTVWDRWAAGGGSS